MGKYGDVGDVEVGRYEKKLYEFHGDYRLKVKKISDGVGGHKKLPFFSVLFEVVESSNEEVHPGTDIVYTTVENPGFREAYLRNIKSCLAAIGDASPNDVGEEEVEAALSIDQPCTNLEVRCSVYQRDKMDRNKKPTGEKKTVQEFRPAE